MMGYDIPAQPPSMILGGATTRLHRVANVLSAIPVPGLVTGEFGCGSHTAGQADRRDDEIVGGDDGVEDG